MDCCIFPIALPTMTFSAARYMLTTGASVEKYMSVAPESTMPVAFVGSASCWRLWLALALLMFGKVEGVISRVLIKLEV